MKLTIVKEDDLVIVDDYPINFNVSTYNTPNDFWALQWKSNSGEIEFSNDDVNERIESLPDWTDAIIAEHARLKAELEKPHPTPTPEEEYQEMIRQRDQMLDENDWTIMRHKDEIDLGMTPTLSATAYQNTLIWRQQLRDMPESLKAGYKAGEATPKWTWPTIPPELEDDFPDYPPE